MKKSIIYFCSGILLLTGCKKEEKNEEVCTNCENDSFLYVSNEGGWPATGTVTAINLSKKTSQNDFYIDANSGAELGTTLQSLFVSDKKGFAMVTGADQVVVFNIESGLYQGEISINYPRYMVSDEDFGYITSGKTAGKLYKVDLTSNDLTDSVSVGSGPEQLVVVGEKIVIANSGGWSKDSTISVVDVSSFELDTNVFLGPKIMDVSVDANSKVWALSSVYWEGTNNSTLFQLDPSDWSVLKTIELTSTSESVSKIAISSAKDKIYYCKSDGVYSLSIDASVAPSSPMIEKGGWYGIEVNPSTDNLYLFNSGGGLGNGFVSEYNMEGDSLTSYTVGQFANGGVFRN